MNIVQQLKRGVKWSGGFAVYHLPFLSGLRRDYLSRMYSPPENGGWLFRSFRGYVLGEKAYEQLPEFRTAILTGESGRRWAEFYRSRPEEYYLEGFKEQLHACEELLRSGSYSRFLQIGCAGGRELAILASRFPQVQFCGIDLNAEAIRENQTVYRELGNLEFRAADLNSVETWANWRPDVIYSSGCLEYLTEQEAAGFIHQAHAIGVSRLVVCEPTDGAVSGHSVRRGGGAFAHDYRHLAEQGGWPAIDVISAPTQQRNLVLLVASREADCVLRKAAR